MKILMLTKFVIFIITFCFVSCYREEITTLNDGKVIKFMEIGIKIRRLRLAKSLSQEDLAASLGISQTTLHYIETGQSKK